MNDLQSLQRHFLAYLQHADVSIKGEISDAKDTDRAKRLSIYYNAYRSRLRGSIEVDHPVLARYLGDGLFDEMAERYIESFPSSQISLRHFCDQLPEFLASHEPFARQPVLAGIANFERTLMDVFDAADAEHVDRSYLSRLPPSRWPILVFHLHPSVRLYSSEFNVVEIWQALKSDLVPPAATHGAGNCWLLWRNRDRLSEFRSVDEDEFALLVAALEGQQFSNLCEALLEWHSANDVAARASMLVMRWHDDGLVVEPEHAGD